MTRAGDIARQAIGHAALQDPWELAGLLAVLEQDPPKLVLEVGCWEGGTLYAWRQLGAEVIGVTLAGHANILKDHGATILLSDSREARGKLEGALAGRVPGFVFIDGGHTAELAWSDWRLARDVAPGALVAFHDIANPEYPGVARVWAHVAGQHPHLTFVNPPAGMGIGLVVT